MSMEDHFALIIGEPVEQGVENVENAKKGKKSSKKKLSDSTLQQQFQTDYQLDDVVCPKCGEMEISYSQSQLGYAYCQACGIGFEEDENGNIIEIPPNEDYGWVKDATDEELLDYAKDSEEDFLAPSLLAVKEELKLRGLSSRKSAIRKKAEEPVKRKRGRPRKVIPEETVEESVVEPIEGEPTKEIFIEPEEPKKRGRPSKSETERRQEEQRRQLEKQYQDDLAKGKKVPHPFWSDEWKGARRKKADKSAMKKKGYINDVGRGHWECPKGCDIDVVFADGEYIYDEDGNIVEHRPVQVNIDGTVTNRYYDGVAGISDEARDNAENDSEPQCSECLEYCNWVPDKEASRKSARRKRATEISNLPPYNGVTCLECGWTGKASEFNKNRNNCPHCGSPDVAIQPTTQPYPEQLDRSLFDTGFRTSEMSREDVKNEKIYEGEDAEQLKDKIKDSIKASIVKEAIKENIIKKLNEMMDGGKGFSEVYQTPFPWDEKGDEVRTCELCDEIYEVEPYEYEGWDKYCRKCAVVPEDTYSYAKKYKEEDEDDKVIEIIGKFEDWVVDHHPQSKTAGKVLASVLEEETPYSKCMEIWMGGEDDFTAILKIAGGDKSCPEFSSEAFDYENCPHLDKDSHVCFMSEAKCVPLEYEDESEVESIVLERDQEEI